MATRKCCVGGCSATNKTHRLFNIPKNDSLRELWLSFLIPTNIKLSGLSKEQLILKQVCQNHFDQYQFDKMGNRLQHGYPCLFTEEEILHGIPLRSPVDNIGDHSYCNLTMPDDSNDPTAMIIVEGDHSYTAMSVSQNAEPVEIIQSTCFPCVEGELNVKPMPENESSSSIKRTNNLFRKQSRSKYTSFVRKMKKMTIIENKKMIAENLFSDRFSKAEDLIKDKSIMNNFNRMTKSAQNFLMMQLKMAGKKKKAMRFTNDEKLLSLSLMKESPKGYRLLQKIFNLPSKRTLNRLAEGIVFKSGINDNIFRLLKRKVSKWDVKEKLCTIIFDEMALTPHLKYVESHDEVSGFTDFGGKRHFKFCDHALVFMLRGICSNWRQPICYYFCEGTVSSISLKNILEDLVTKVCQADLIPLALVCDQGSTFRAAIKTFKQETTRKRNLNGEHSDGTIEISGQHLSVVYDPPHLLKGLRNNFMSKDMTYKDKIASWKDILTVYNIDCQLGHTKMIGKLTDHHVIPEKIKKMKVSVAAQVLSARTSAMLKYTSLFTTLRSGETVSETMATTGEAVEFMDKLFDSVNGSRRGAVRGKLRGAIKPTSQHFAFWQEAKEIIKKIKFIDAKSKKAINNKEKYLIRVPSLDGWIITLESFERIAKLLFNKYGIKYFYPRNINQDPLENFFGRIRALNYRNVNPDAYTFVNSFKSLLISNVIGPHSIYSNCEEDDGKTIIDFLNLLKSDIEDKENIAPAPNTPNYNKIPSNNIVSDNLIDRAINEKMRVHSSAYTSGYLCRKLNRKFKCKNCKKTYTAEEKENTHDFIAHREYKLMKNSNLCYPSKKFLMLYRDIADHIHNYMNDNAHNKNLGRKLKNNIMINNKVDLRSLACTLHKNDLIDLLIKLIIRLHVHNWCNIINKILKGAVSENSIKSAPQKLALLKYKAYRLRNKKNK